MDFTFFAKKGSEWKYDGLESLKKIRLGCIEAYPYSEAIDAYIKSAQGTDKVQVASGDNALETNIRKLRAGRMDALVETSQVVSWTCRQMTIPEGDIVAVGNVGNPQPIHIAFSPAKPESKKLAELFAAGLSELRQSGELKKILLKYGLTDWK